MRIMHWNLGRASGEGFSRRTSVSIKAIDLHILFILFYHCLSMLYVTHQTPQNNPNASASHRTTRPDPLLLQYKSARHLVIMPLSAKLHQIPIVLEFHIRLSFQAPPRHLDIHPDVLDQALLTHVVVFRPDKAEDEQVHARAVEVLAEGVEDVDFLVAPGGEVRRVSMRAVHFAGFFFEYPVLYVQGNVLCRKKRCRQ